MKNKWIAIFFALVGGWFGLHRFYLRQTELGVLYILINFVFSLRFFNIPLTMVIAWYDAYRLFLMDNDQFNQKYNSYFFRDRYGRRREKAKEKHQDRGRYILIDNEEGGSQKSSTNQVFNVKKKLESNTFKQAGIKMFKEYDLSGAIENFEKAIEITPEDKTLHFNIACAYSMIENEYKSFFHLNQATLLGFNDNKRILSHEALAYIRVLPPFQKFKNNQFRLTQSDLEQIQIEMLERQALQLKERIQISRPIEQIRMMGR